MPGIPVYAGADMTAPVVGFGFGAPTAFPVVPPQSLHAFLYDVYYRGFVVRDPGADAMAFDPLNPGAYQERVSYLSSLTWAGNPDLSAFQKRGGKLLLLHGTSDSLIPIGWTTEYYQSVVAKMGATVTDGFMRYWQIPGLGHASGPFLADWDSLAALDNWVENGKAVDGGVVADLNPENAHRTRPLCSYPSWPKYNGSGDVNSATSFTCAKS